MFPNLKAFIIRHNDEIIREMTDMIQDLPSSLYRDILLEAKHGKNRIEYWVGLINMILAGKSEAVFKVQKAIGYLRAIQGHQSEDMARLYLFFQQSVTRLLQGVQKKDDKDRILFFKIYEEYQNFTLLISNSQIICTSAFMKATEERLAEQVTHLHEVFDFGREVVTKFEMEEILDLVLTKVTALFGTKNSCLATADNNRIQKIYGLLDSFDPHNIFSIMRRSITEDEALFLDTKGAVYNDPDLFGIKQLASIPFHAHGICYGAIALYNGPKGFKFTKKEMGLLQQFLNILAIAMENSVMVKELEKKRQELHLLSGQLMTIQEEERRRLAADIHDTVTQSLSGIGFMLQSYKEYSRKRPELLKKQLDNLIETVNDTINQSRELIASLRPELIDTVGLIAAIKKSLNTFTHKTKVMVTARLPEQMDLESDMSIGLFRVAQEALINVYKHAGSDSAELTLRKENNAIVLIVADKGKGFNPAQVDAMAEGRKTFGLLTIKERVKTLGGTLVIDTDIGKGCQIKATFPMRAEACNDE